MKNKGQEAVFDHKGLKRLITKCNMRLWIDLIIEEEKTYRDSR
jgi:hypothetical protein